LWFSFKKGAQPVLHQVRNCFPPAEEFFSSVDELLIAIKSILQLYMTVRDYAAARLLLSWPLL
jgi:hypothetical protein